MPRLMLSDEFWSKLEKILLQEAVYNKQRNLRMTVEAVSNTDWLSMSRLAPSIRIPEFGK